MKYREVFPKGRQLFVVIHTENPNQAIRNAGVACESGAAGVFLINHNVDADMLAASYAGVRREYPHLWTGLNFLDLDNEGAIRTAGRLGASAIWLDNAGDGVKEAKCLREWQQEHDAENLIIFGGVAFKGQRQVTDPGLQARLIAPCVDVVTTSGIATGKPPTIGKIRAMKGEILTHPLAIASGITKENVLPFIPHIDCFLVATGVSETFTELDPVKVRALSDVIASH